MGVGLTGSNSWPFATIDNVASTTPLTQPAQRVFTIHLLLESSIHAPSYRTIPTRDCIGMR